MDAILFIAVILLSALVVVLLRTAIKQRATLRAMQQWYDQEIAPFEGQLETFKAERQAALLRYQAQAQRRRKLYASRKRGVHK